MYRQYKNIIVNGNLVPKYKIEETHKFHTELLKLLGYELTAPYMEWLYITETSVIPVRHIYRQGGKTTLLIMEMQTMIPVGDTEPDGLFGAKGLFEKYGKDIETTEGKLKQVEAVLRNEKSLTEASQFKQELEVKMAGEEYKRSKSLFTDWDGTTAQRQQFSDLIKARQDEAKARQDLSQARETFSLLTADMADRQAKAKLQEDAIRQLEEQIGKQAHHEELHISRSVTRC